VYYFKGRIVRHKEIKEGAILRRDNYHKGKKRKGKKKKTEKKRKQTRKGEEKRTGKRRRKRNW